MNKDIGVYYEYFNHFGLGTIQSEPPGVRIQQKDNRVCVLEHTSAF